MDVYTHGLRCQIVPADRDDGGRLEYDIFGAPYSDNVVTSAATFATTEEARAALETHAAEGRGAHRGRAGGVRHHHTADRGRWLQRTPPPRLSAHGDPRGPR